MLERLYRLPPDGNDTAVAAEAPTTTRFIAQINGGCMAMLRPPSLQKVILDRAALKISLSHIRVC